MQIIFKLLIIALLNIITFNLHSQDQADSDTLLKASNHLALEYLLQSSNEKTGLWIDQHETVSMKYEKTGKMVEVEVPIRKIVGYEDAWHWVNKGDDDDPYKKVYEKYKKPIYKVVGYEKKMVEESKPSKTQSSAYFCQRRYIEAMNGLCAYTLLELEESNNINEKFFKYYDWQNYMMTFGLSDNTAELSLQILMMMKSKQSRHKKMIMQGLEKLINGQIDSGKAKGLWGYYSVDWQFIPYFDQQEAQVDKKIEALRLPKIEDDTKITPHLQKKIDIKRDLDQAKEAIIKARSDISREFYIGRDWMKNRKYTDTQAAVPTHYLWPNTEFDARKKRVGTLISTQFALYALNEALKSGYFEKDSIKEFNELKIKKLMKAGFLLRLPPFPNYEKAVSNTLLFLKNSQQDNGEWDILEQEQPIKHPFPEMLKSEKKFDGTGYKDKINKHQHKRIPSNLTSTVTAMHCLSLIQQIENDKQFNSKNDKLIKTGLTAYEKMIEQIIAKEELLEEYTPITLYPYNIIITIPDIHKSFETKFLLNSDSKKSLIDFVLKIQQDNGTFNKDVEKYFHVPYLVFPFFPDVIQEEWVTNKWYDGYWEHGQINTTMISTSLMLLFYHKIKPELKFETEYKTALEDFTQLRSKLYGIETDILNQEAVEEKIDTEKAEEKNENQNTE